MTNQNLPNNVRPEIPRFSPIYAEGLEREKIVDLDKTSQLIFELLRERNIPVVEDAVVIRWHCGEPPNNEAEAQAIEAVNRLARTGELGNIVDEIGKKNLRYLYWHSNQYGDFPFGIVISRQVCCSMNDYWLLNFRREKICSYKMPPVNTWRKEESEHLLIIYK